MGVGGSSNKEGSWGVGGGRLGGGEGDKSRLGTSKNRPAGWTLIKELRWGNRRTAQMKGSANAPPALPRMFSAPSAAAAAADLRGPGCSEGAGVGWGGGHRMKTTWGVNGFSDKKKTQNAWQPTDGQQLLCRRGRRSGCSSSCFKAACSVASQSNCLINAANHDKVEGCLGHDDPW